MSNKSRFVFVAALLVAGTAIACECLEFKHATAVMATPTMGSAYVSLVSEKDDTLTGLSSDCCDAVELHTMTMDDGIMRMRKLDELPLKAGVPVEINGGKGDTMHLMLIGVKKPMKLGQKFNISFNLAKEGAHKTAFKVVSRAGKEAAVKKDDSMPGMDMSHGHH